jgi:plasmid stabilization system protein ParE
MTEAEHNLDATFIWRAIYMPQGDKSAYTEKQKRKAGHIEDSYRRKGVPSDEAEERAWATVNKQDGGGQKSGAGRHPSASAGNVSRQATSKKARRSAK